MVTLAVYFEKEPVPYKEADWSATYTISKVKSNQLIIWKVTHNMMATH